MSYRNQINWKSQNQGNKWMQPIHPDMLGSNGYEKVRALYHRNCPIINGRPDSSYRDQFVVLYDRDYVIEKIIKQLIIPLEMNKEGIDLLLVECWEKLGLKS